MQLPVSYMRDPDKKPELSNGKFETSWEVMRWLGSNTEKLLFRTVRWSSQETKLFFISYHFYAQQLGGKSAKVILTLSLKQLDFYIYYQCTVQVSCMKE